jgi:hypothetical protein
VVSQIPPNFHPGNFAAALAAGSAMDSSPLQRMASITNSLVSQPLPAPGFGGQRPLKAVLPPITQHQVKVTYNYHICMVMFILFFISKSFLFYIIKDSF